MLDFVQGVASLEFTTDVSKSILASTEAKGDKGSGIVDYRARLKDWAKEEQWKRTRRTGFMASSAAERVQWAFYD